MIALYCKKAHRYLRVLIVGLVYVLLYSGCFPTHSNPVWMGGMLKQLEPIFWCLDDYIISAPFFTYISTQKTLKASWTLNITKTTYSTYPQDLIENLKITFQLFFFVLALYVELLFPILFYSGSRRKCEYIYSYTLHL